MNITFNNFAKIIENAYIEDGVYDRKIDMINTLRERFDLSLKDAKNLAEWYIEYRKLNCAITASFVDQAFVFGEVQYQTNYHFCFVDDEPTLADDLTDASKTSNKKFVVITLGNTYTINEFNTKLEADAAVSMSFKLGYKAKLYQEI